MQRREKVTAFWNVYEPSLETMYLNEEASALDAHERPEILGYLPDVKGSRILELAAGIGRFTGRFAEMGARHITAVDLVDKFVDANRHNNAHHPNIDHVCADATTLAYPAESFDLIFINWMMMYLEDAEMTALAQRMSSWLKPGGHLFLRESCAEERTDLDIGYYVHYRTAAEYQAAFKSTLQVKNHGRIHTHERLLNNQHQLFWLWQRPQGR